MTQQISISELEAKLRKDTTLYHPGWNTFTGSTNATLFLAQVSYWWHLEWKEHPPGSPFYKFLEPCNHNCYNPDDSWVEELSLGRRQVINARESLGRQIKAGSGETHEIVFAEGHLVAWVTDQDRKTWYWLNQPLLDQHLYNLYFLNAETAFRKNSLNAETAFSQMPKQHFDSRDYPPETTLLDNSLVDNLGSDNNELQYKPVDETGTPVSEDGFDKNDPDFLLFMSHLKGKPKNLEGRQRTMWLVTKRRCDQDPKFKEWCNKRLSDNTGKWFWGGAYRALWDQEHYQMFLEGTWVETADDIEAACDLPKDCNPKGRRRRFSRWRQGTDETAEEILAREKASLDAEAAKIVEAMSKIDQTTLIWEGIDNR